MRLIDADQLLEDLMKYVTGGDAENPSDCAEINRLIKEAPTVDNTADIKERIKKAVNKCDYMVVDGYIYIQIFELEQAIDKA